MAGWTGGRTVRRRSRLAAPDSRRGEGHATARCVSAVRLPGVSVLSVVAQCQWWVVAHWVAQCQWWVVAQWEGTVTVGRHSGKVGRPPPAPVYRHDAGAPCQVCHCQVVQVVRSSAPWRRSLHRGAAILGRLMPRFSHAQQACQVCQCSQWWHTGKDCPPLPSPVRVQVAGHATLPSSTATVWAAEADEAQRARAVEQLRDSELGEVRLQLRVIAQELLALGAVKEDLHGPHHTHVRLDASEAHCLLRVTELQERRGERGTK